jgi:hypothetical protein
MSRRTLIDISRLGTDTTWPAVATEVNGYLQNWLAAANAQVSHRPQPHGHCHGSLRLASGGNPDATHPRR